MTDRFCLGDEAIAQAALDAGITAAYAYPGTPATESFEYLARAASDAGTLRASWCANEKVAMESALGASMMGHRSVAIMKHVGLNVAADPFLNAALVAIRGGLVVVVADDPGMHSSQNEQDSRFYADFAHVPCLEPTDHQQAYDMTREAFELSERFQVPVMVRVVTRLAHTRRGVLTGPPASTTPVEVGRNRSDWVLLPANARRRWETLLARQSEMQAWSERTPYNRLTIQEGRRGLAVLTTGIARAYYREHLGDLGSTPSDLHIGAYPVPVAMVRRLVEAADRVLVLEEGYPFVERWLRGLVPPPVAIAGKLSGEVPPTGELTPDSVGIALGLPLRQTNWRDSLPIPPRPPQLCEGCPHHDTFSALRDALDGWPGTVVTGDIGCYTLGALPPYDAIESCVCMGASIGMARGVADTGHRPVLAVIGDSTFIHSGIAPLIDAVHDDVDLTIIILDNGAVGMTGAQDPALPSSRLAPVVLGVGVPPEHCHVVEAHPRHRDSLRTVIQQEIGHRGVSVIIARRECLVHARRRPAGSRSQESP